MQVFMQREREEAARRIHEAYLQCKATFNPNLDAINDMVSFDDEEEEFFYKTVSDFFIKRKQWEIINQDSYGKK